MPIHRRAARAIPVVLSEPEPTVLLLRSRDPAEPDEWHWSSAGGGLNRDEAPESAAVRELAEETGIAADPATLIGPVHRGTYDFAYAGIAYRSDSEFFALPMDAQVEADFSGLERLEVGHVVEARWWSATELRRARDAGEVLVVPDDLPDTIDASIAAVQTAAGARTSEEGAER